MKEHMLDTPHGTLYTAISKPTSVSTQHPAILFLHGNSCNSRIFEPLLANQTLRENHTLVVFDLPGHGRSSNARFPEISYTQAGYAAAALDVLQYYNIREVVVLGWSLGGHNAIELVPLLQGPKNTTGIRLLGIMIVGTPPALGAEQVSRGFHGDAHMGMAATEKLSADDMRGFAEAMTKVTPAAEWMRETVVRTDGRARRIMFKAFTDGKGCDQMGVLVNWENGICAIVNGGAEPYVNLDYCDEVGEKIINGKGKLWEGKCHRLEGLEHAPFFEDPNVFTPMFLRWVEDCSKLAKE